MKRNITLAIILVLSMTSGAFAESGTNTLKIIIENLAQRDYTFKKINQHCIQKFVLPHGLKKEQANVAFELSSAYSGGGCMWKSSGIQIQIINTDGTTVGEFTAHKPLSKPWINLSCNMQQSKKEYLRCSGQNTVVILPK